MNQEQVEEAIDRLSRKYEAKCTETADRVYAEQLSAVGPLGINMPRLTDAIVSLAKYQAKVDVLLELSNVLFSEVSKSGQ